MGEERRRVESVRTEGYEKLGLKSEGRGIYNDENR